ncbi:MAG: FG-GAP repeat domain-containing protein, partial [Thermoplasmata archaeon]
MTERGGPIRFADETRSSGTDDHGWGLAAGAADYDGDGRIDLYVANDFGRSVLYRNVTEPHDPIRFEDVTSRVGLMEPGFGMGVAWGDFDLDGDFDLYATHYWFDERWILTDRRFPLPPSSPSGLPGPTRRRKLSRYVTENSLFRNDAAQSGRFVGVSGQAGVFDAGWAWGAAWTDADGDGLLDLAVATGMLPGKHGRSREIDFWNELSAGWREFSAGSWTVDFGEDGITGPQPERLFLNLGDGTFAEVGYAAGFDTTADLRGLIAADITGDGAPDLVGGAFLASPVIYENTNVGGAARVRVLLEGTASNWDAVGA